MKQLLIALSFALPCFAEDMQMVRSPAGMVLGDPGPPGGHRTMRLGVSGGRRTDYGGVWSFNYRFALHDILDRQNEYPDNTGIEFLGVTLDRAPSVNKWFLDEVLLLRILRMPPLTGRWEEFTWKLEAGWRTLRDSTCLYCGAANVLGGIGATVEPIDGLPVAAFGLLEAEFLASNGYTGFPVKPSLGARGGLRFRLAPWLNGWVYGVYRAQFLNNVAWLGDWGTEWRVALLRNLALNTRLNYTGIGWEFLVGAYFYF